jgi:hypothetical protein
MSPLAAMSRESHGAGKAKVPNQSMYHRLQMTTTETTTAALEGALIGGGLSIVASVIASVLTVLWSDIRSRTRAELQSLARARQLVAELWSVQSAPTAPDSPQRLGRQNEVKGEIVQIASQLSLKKHLGVAIALYTISNGQKIDYYMKIADEIAMLTNPKLMKLFQAEFKLNKA